LGGEWIYKHNNNVLESSAQWTRGLLNLIESIESSAHSYLLHRLLLGLNFFGGTRTRWMMTQKRTSGNGCPFQWSENAHFNMACAIGPSMNRTSKIELNCDKTRLFSKFYE
jgi:hypothetical protein